MPQGPLLKAPAARSEAAPVALCCVAGSGPAQATVCSPWTPQVGVSEAGLQHEILRRARELLDAARIQPGTNTKLACGLWWGAVISLLFKSSPKG